ncbi:hypothetical protein Q8G41_27135, partial [Klebsiella pneumoniae]|uniref:hypothetical protein n=1 Tax=Klebsiella pneumoniae TaxID=573 RepID=UPI0030132858
KFDVTLVVETQKSSTVDIVFHPTGATTAVTVKDVTPIVTTDTAALGYTLDNSRIEQLPINGRNVLNLMATVPGMSLDSSGNLRTFGGRIGTHDVL